MKALTFGFGVILLLQICQTRASPDLVPLYRLLNSKNGDHFYTINLTEAMYSVSAFGYKFENQAGTVAATAGCNLTPVYRLFNQRNDHFYTTSDVEASVAASQGYVREGIAFYCAANVNECGASTAFHRFVVGSYDHFYTTNVNEGFAAVQNGGKYEGIMCFTW